MNILGSLWKNEKRNRKHSPKQNVNGMFLYKLNILTVHAIRTSKRHK